jgi:hypothetical protein
MRTGRLATLTTLVAAITMLVAGPADAGKKPKYKPVDPSIQALNPEFEGQDPIVSGVIENDIDSKYFQRCSGRIPTVSVDIKFTDGTQQTMEGRVNEFGVTQGFWIVKPTTSVPMANATVFIPKVVKKHFVCSAATVSDVAGTS